MIEMVDRKAEGNLITSTIILQITIDQQPPTK